MGEIKIKSGNLFDIEHYIDTAIIHNMEITPIKNGIRLTSTSSNDPYCNPSYWGVGITVPLDMRKSLLPCKPSTKYTIMLNQTVTVKKIVSYVDENFTIIQNFTSFNDEVANIRTPENCTYIILRIGNESTMPEGTTVEVTNIQLLEGTYTSETIPEYQPYFLNRPAHQFVNGQWVDIPTHHYTNGSWQGELTSQSPLKFRADGEMLDWRVEGKTSGNLLESFRTTGNTGQYKVCLLGKLDIKPSTSYTISFIMEEGAKAYFSEYIFVFKNFTGTGQRQVFNVTTRANINKNASTWTDEYGWMLCKNMDNNENPCNFREVMILEGIYTSETIPDYEPYGGVGDWDETAQKYRIPVTVNGATTNIYTDHQLMDGDSIDFSTDQTQIPIATGNNILTVDTAVKPKSVFVKFEG